MTQKEMENFQNYSRYAKMETGQLWEPERSGRKIVAAVVIGLLAAGLAVFAYLYYKTHEEITIFGHHISLGVSREAVPEDANLPAETERNLETAAETEDAAAEGLAAEFSPYHTDATNPDNLIAYTEIEKNGRVLSDVSEYDPWYHFDFSQGDAYTDVEGIITFRGNNFRDTAAYGLAEMEEKTLQASWSKGTGGLSYKNATWTGSGWTGQPLIVKWPAKTKEAMNLYDWAKKDDDLVEVIYACMDGYVYFLDLRTGSLTRDPLYLGFTFKGAGALDPRGYPIMYVGAGYDSTQGTARVFVINLLDCSVMHTFGNDDPFSLRYGLSYFDSSALVDAASDTLIYPGENGILYLIKLNTKYDEAGGTLAIDPEDVVKWHYQGTRTSTAAYWLGMEDSAAIY